MIEQLEEVLEHLWIKKDKGAQVKMKNVRDEDLSALMDRGLTEVVNDNVVLTTKGQKVGRGIVRRHRLAERLLHDVLQMSNTEVHDQACRFEHILSPGVEENICTLLGHPKVCPHGTPIPPGPCCEERRIEAKSIVVPLTDLGVGEKGIVSYLHTKRHPRLHKLMSFGIVPGLSVHVHRTSPSLVIQVGETTIALERGIGEDIFVRRKGRKTGED
jgi:DtxR family Mn-dependent transcriptional regulator